MKIVIVKHSFKHLFVGGTRKSTLVSDVDLTCPCDLKENSCDTGCCCDEVLPKNSLCHNTLIYFCKKPREPETLQRNDSLYNQVISGRFFQKKVRFMCRLKTVVWLKGLFDVSAAPSIWVA